MFIGRLRLGFLFAKVRRPHQTVASDDHFELSFLQVYTREVSAPSLCGPQQEPA